MIEKDDKSSYLMFEDKRVTNSRNRNGTYVCKGVDIFKMSNSIHITGITKKGGNIASGWLAIPKEDIYEFIELLKAQL